jgi:hypothetical protein
MFTDLCWLCGSRNAGGSRDLLYQQYHLLSPTLANFKLQPCDISVFEPLNTAYRDRMERLNRDGVDTIGKHHFTYHNLTRDFNTMEITRARGGTGIASAAGTKKRSIVKPHSLVARLIDSCSR